MTVEEHKKKFIDLLRFVTSIVGDHRERCRRLEEGFQFEIRTTIIAS